jgi:hypothetical protein
VSLSDASFEEALDLWELEAVDVEQLLSPVRAGRRDRVEDVEDGRRDDRRVRTRRLEKRRG